MVWLGMFSFDNYCIGASGAVQLSTITEEEGGLVCSRLCGVRSVARVLGVICGATHHS